MECEFSMDFKMIMIRFRNEEYLRDIKVRKYYRKCFIEQMFNLKETVTLIYT